MKKYNAVFVFSMILFFFSLFENSTQWSAPSIHAQLSVRLTKTRIETETCRGFFSHIFVTIYFVIPVWLIKDNTDHYNIIWQILLPGVNGHCLQDFSSNFLHLLIIVIFKMSTVGERMVLLKKSLTQEYIWLIKAHQMLWHAGELINHFLLLIQFKVAGCAGQVTSVSQCSWLYNY